MYGFGDRVSHASARRSVTKALAALDVATTGDASRDTTEMGVRALNQAAAVSRY